MKLLYYLFLLPILSYGEEAYLTENVINQEPINKGVSIDGGQGAQGAQGAQGVPIDGGPGAQGVVRADGSTRGAYTYYRTFPTNNNLPMMVRWCRYTLLGRWQVDQDPKILDSQCSDACSHVYNKPSDYGCEKFIPLENGGDGEDLMKCVLKNYGDLCYDARFKHYNLIVRNVTELSRGIGLRKNKNSFFNTQPWYKIHPESRHEIIHSIIDQVYELRKTYKAPTRAEALKLQKITTN